MQTLVLAVSDPAELTQDQRLTAARHAARTRQPISIAAAPVALRPWHFGLLTAQQQLERRLMEQAMRDGTLRGLPSCFGELAA